MNEYIVGSGPSGLTVIAYEFGYLGYYDIGDYQTLPPNKENETEDEYIERIRVFHQQRLASGDGNIEGREAMLFLGPSVDVSIEAWKVMRQWRLEQRGDGAVVAVHPQRDAWLELRPNDFQQHRSALEVELPAFTQAVTTAHQARVTANGGRTRPEPTFPKLVSDANKLSAYFREVGAYSDPNNPPTKPPPACGLAVPDKAANPGLSRDCLALLAAEDKLRGTATLNWDPDTAIAKWDGVTVAGTPKRVTRIVLTAKSLTGSVPAELGRLDGLQVLHLDDNALTGGIPVLFGGLSSLRELRLSGNQLSGCIPAALRSVADNDLDTLGLPYCGA